jgi:hypothetical protein
MIDRRSSLAVRPDAVHTGLASWNIIAARSPV